MQCPFLIRRQPRLSRYPCAGFHPAHREARENQTSLGVRLTDLRNKWLSSARNEHEARYHQDIAEDDPWADRFNFSQERDGEKHGEERGRVQ
jgi:hypothetical protein